MSYPDFQLSVKSTIDYWAKQVADAVGLPFLDLDGSEFQSAIVESDQPAICWEFSTIQEDPKDPMWFVSFDIGAMTMLDPAQYISLDLVGKLIDQFKVGSRIAVRNYSGVSMPVSDVGAMLIVSAGITPQQQDKTTGFRFVSIMARVTRWP